MQKGFGHGFFLNFSAKYFQKQQKSAILQNGTKTKILYRLGRTPKRRL